MSRIRRIIVAALALLSAVSCQWRPLVDPDDSLMLKVVIEVKAVLNVSTSIYNEKIPVPEIKSDMFRVLFFDPNTGKLVSQAFISEKTTNSEGQDCLGGTIKISPGTYDMIAYNFDTPDTQVEGTDDITTLYAHTSKISESIKQQYADKYGDDDNIYYEPDHVVVAREKGLKITQHTGVLVIESTASTIVDTYYLQVRVEGAQYSGSASAILSGMVPSNHFGLAQRDTENPCSIYFTLQTSTDEKLSGDNKDVLCCLFNTFGKIYYDENGNPTKTETSSDSDLYITFSVTRTDGEILEYNINMNDIFNSEDAIERHWLLINDTIVIPAPEPTPTPSSGGGFQPQVGDWDNQYSEIVL